jgi:transcriptional regulator with XRE-family HTH domain
MEVNAAFIKQKRTINGWTQQHLADMCSVSLRTVQRVERYGQASNETVSSLASVLEVNRIEIIEILPQENDFEDENKKSHLLFIRKNLAVYICGVVSGVLVSYFTYVMR